MSTITALRNGNWGVVPEDVTSNQSNIMKIQPCKKCNSTDIKLYDCGYSSFNCGGGTCRNCGFIVTVSTLRVFPTQRDLTVVWNDGQKPTPTERLDVERKKTRKLRKQLREAGLDPVI